MDVSIDPMDGNWVSPRLSFSHDLIHMPVELTSVTQREKLGMSEEDFSFGFSNPLNDSELLRPHATCLMLSPDELFCNGKLLPLERRHSIAGRGHARTSSMMMMMMAHYPQCHHGYNLQEEVETTTSLGGMSRSIQDKPRSVSMTVTSSRGNNCYHSSCDTSANSRVSSPWREMHATTEAAGAACHMPPRASASASASTSIETACSLFRPSSSSRYQRSRVKEFFKLRKGWPLKDPQHPPPPPHHHDHATCSSTAVPREESLLAATSPSSSGRISTSKSFWPFSRSNSAGESKSPPAYPSPLPKRSNSSGEGKTTSSSLLPPSHGIDKGTDKGIDLGIDSIGGRESSVGDQRCPTSQANLPSRQSFSCHDQLLELSPHLTPTAAKSSSSPPATTNDDVLQHSLISSADGDGDGAGAGRKGLPPLPTATKIQCCAAAAAAATGGLPSPRPSHDAQAPRKGGVGDDDDDDDDGGGGGGGGGRPTSSSSSSRRLCNSSPPSRNFARSSPGRRRGVWNSPGRGNSNANGARITVRSLDRGGLGRPRSALLRGQAQRQRGQRPNGRVVLLPPVLNVPYIMMPPPPARRPTSSTSSTIKPPPPSSTSKSNKVFTTLGGFFSKKERRCGSAYVLLTTTSSSITSSSDCRNGG